MYYAGYRAFEGVLRWCGAERQQRRTGYARCGVRCGWDSDGNWCNIYNMVDYERESIRINTKI